MGHIRPILPLYRHCSSESNTRERSHVCTRDCIRFHAREHTCIESGLLKFVLSFHLVIRKLSPSRFWLFSVLCLTAYIPPPSPPPPVNTFPNRPRLARKNLTFKYLSRSEPTGAYSRVQHSPLRARKSSIDFCLLAALPLQRVCTFLAFPCHPSPRCFFGWRFASM